jgi:hypothetical protein
MVCTVSTRFVLVDMWETNYVVDRMYMKLIS